MVRTSRRRSLSFFVPNELEAGDFEGIWERGIPIKHGVRLIEAIDLIVTKQLTNRPHDETDIRFLTRKIESEYRFTAEDVLGGGSCLYAG